MDNISAIPAKREQPVKYSTPELIAALSQCGIRYLMAVDRSASNPVIDLPELIGCLAAHPEPRLREALIPLFIRIGHSGETIKQALIDKTPQECEVIQHMYIAAAYLQRLWQSTLGIYLDDLQLLPDLFGQTRYHLPAPTEDYGEAGLRLLATQFQEKTGYDWYSAYESVISLFLQQLIPEAPAHVRFSC